MSKIKEYSSKIVYIGIDVHKNTYSVAAVCEGVVVKKPFTQRASPALLATSLQRMFAGAEIQAVYEAGFSGFHLQRFLEDKGIKCFVVDPGMIEKSPKAIAKTDKIDALMLVSHLAAGRLRFVRVPSLEEEFDRLVTRTREQLVENRTCICNVPWALTTSLVSLPPIRLHHQSFLKPRPSIRRSFCAQHRCQHRCRHRCLI